MYIYEYPVCSKYMIDTCIGMYSHPLLTKSVVMLVRTLRCYEDSFGTWGGFRKVKQVSWICAHYICIPLLPTSQQVFIKFASWLARQ